MAQFTSIWLNSFHLQNKLTSSILLTGPCRLQIVPGQCLRKHQLAPASALPESVRTIKQCPTLFNWLAQKQPRRQGRMLPPNSCTLPLAPHGAGRGVRADRRQALSIHIPLHLAGNSLDSYTPSMIYQESNSKGRKTGRPNICLSSLFQPIFQSAVETGSLIWPCKPRNVLPSQEGI